MNAKRFIAAGQGIVLHPVSKRPLTTERVEQVGFGVIGEYLDLTGEGYAFRLLLAAPALLEACKAAISAITGGSKYPDLFPAEIGQSALDRLEVALALAEPQQPVTFPPAVDPLARMEE